MTKRLLLLRDAPSSRWCRALAAGAAALCVPAVLYAAGSYPVPVGATILSKNNCTFSTTTGTIAFGAIDPSSASAVTASVTLTFRCTGSGNPVVYSITSNDGQHKLGAGQPRMADAGATNFLAYTLNTPLSASTPKNTDTNIAIQGTVTPAQFQNAPATSYADTVILTVSP